MNGFAAPLCCSAWSPSRRPAGCSGARAPGACAGRGGTSASPPPMSDARPSANGATLLQFSTEFCAPCRATARMLGELAERRTASSTSRWTSPTGRSSRAGSASCRPRPPSSSTPSARARTHRRRAPAPARCVPPLDDLLGSTHVRTDLTPPGSTRARRASAPGSPPCSSWSTSSSALVGADDGRLRPAARRSRCCSPGARSRASSGIRTALLFRRSIRPRLAPPAEREDPAPPTFAQGVGLVVTGLGLVLHLVGVPYALPVAAALAFVAAFLNSVFGYCLGCQIYLLLVRAGVIRRREPPPPDASVPGNPPCASSASEAASRLVEPLAERGSAAANRRSPWQSPANRRRSGTAT